jgi:predicted DNA-binding transcriptional regulator AlpA
MQTTETRLLRAADIATRLNISPASVFRLAAREHNPLPAVRLGGSIRFDWPAIAKWAGIQGEGES